jgi:hypothetical protein
MKLNVGCGTDYREGFINIDGSTSLPRVDLIIDINKVSLLEHFPENSVNYILANDIIEHHFHWEAVSLMRDFHSLLCAGGIAEIRVPDAAYLLRTFRFSIEHKLTMLFGGQDIPQGCNPDMDASRARFPQYFAHKFGWTSSRLRHDLAGVGFADISIRRVGTNCVALARK